MSSTNDVFDFEIAETIEERNRRLKHQVDPITGEPVVLITKKAFLAMVEKELKGEIRNDSKNDRPAKKPEARAEEPENGGGGAESIS